MKSKLLDCVPPYLSNTPPLWWLSPPSLTTYSPLRPFASQITKLLPTPGCRICGPFCLECPSPGSLHSSLLLNFQSNLNTISSERDFLRPSYLGLGILLPICTSTLSLTAFIYFTHKTGSSRGLGPCLSHSLCM